ncbi:MAG: endonuclease, partial [Myxococcota bacterium]
MQSYQVSMRGGPLSPAGKSRRLSVGRQRWARSACEPFGESPLAPNARVESIAPVGPASAGNSVGSRPAARASIGGIRRIIRCAAWLPLALTLATWVGLGTARAEPPAGYYATADSSNRVALRNSLHEIVDDHQRVPYTSGLLDTWDVLEEADEDPSESGSILDVYRNRSFAKVGGGGGGYTRESVWPTSYGFVNDHIENYPYTDCHQRFLADLSYDAARSNRLYGECNAACTERSTDGGTTGVYPGTSNWSSTNIWETWEGRRGDVARALLYMDVRYAGDVNGNSGAAEPDLVLTDDIGLVVSSSSNESIAHMGRL